MKKLLLFVFSLLFFTAVPFQSILAQTQGAAAPTPQEDEFYHGKVVSVLKESEKDEFGQKFFVQDLRIEILNGPDEGKEVTLTYEIGAEKKEQKLVEGQKIVMGKDPRNAETPYYVSDVYRLRAVWFILFFFFVLTVFLARTQGLRAFIGLVLSFVIIFLFIIPFILKGHNPLWISLVGSLGIVSTTLYIAHGFHVRTTVAFVSILLTLGLAALLSFLFVYGAKLFGLGTEEAFFLQSAPIGAINLRGLLLGGILIGTLGVLDDVATAQAATVEELHKANKTFDFKELYNRGLSVGREHIVSLVNTLVLAYTGASFPLLLLFSIYQKPLWVTLNSEIIVEEVIRMLVGSTALILAVPITTALAAYIFSHVREGKDLTNAT